MMPIVRGQYAELLAPGLTMQTFSKYREHPQMFSRIMNVLTSRAAYEDDFRLAGFGPLVQKNELETTILDEPIKLGGIRYIHKTYALGFAISWEMLSDDLYNQMMALAAELGKSSRWTQELYGHDVYNNGFTTTKYAGRDGKALFATDHPIQGLGTTYANRPATDVDLSEAALEAAIGNFDAQVNDRGMPAQIRPQLLVSHPDQRLLMKRLLESSGMPGGNMNDVNPLQGEGITAFSDPWLTDRDMWMLLAPTSELDVKFYWREMPDTKTWDDDNADATFHKIRQRHSVGFGDWRGTYGSTGA